MKSWKIIVSIAIVAAVVAFVFLRTANHTVEFRRALYSGDISQVEKLLQAHPTLANADVDPSKGWTPLHVAANLGDPDLVKLLVHYGAKVDVRDKRGLTPLLWTAFAGRRDAAAALLSNGADINARGPDGRTTLDLAKLSLDNSLIDLLRERGAHE
ncbi:MAG TPA: ankyrin repeat domain-containing protein [Verrucomicrobiae bacterium]|nr:ankyrin repeat domain-containing protein [Verrucomicrobiae bacterium]